MNLSTDIITYIALAAGTISLIAVILLIHAEIRINRLLKGKNARTLEDSIISIDADLKELLQFRKELEHYLESVETRLKKSIQGVSTLRFNPFKGTGSGGNQSFATAFLNEHGDGVILSSLYSRDHVSIFSKPIIKYKSEYELSAEEKDALNLAKDSTKK